MTDPADCDSGTVAVGAGTVVLRAGAALTDALRCGLAVARGLVFEVTGERLAGAAGEAVALGALAVVGVLAGIFWITGRATMEGEVVVAAGPPRGAPLVDGVVFGTPEGAAGCTGDCITGGGLPVVEGAAEGVV